MIAKRVRLVGLDVDGVMTDAGVYIGMGADGPVELKRFNIQDSVGIKLLMAAGIRVVVISGRVSQATRIRAEELGIEDIFQDPDAQKLRALEEVLSRHGMRMEEVAFLGDDLPDLPVLKRVGLPVAVRNAVAEVREVAAYTTNTPGGQGAVRELAEVLLRARGQWDDLVREYLEERGDPMPRVSGAE